MEDSRIVDLYWARDEMAISETAAKYGRYCRAIAWNILKDDQDAQECVNDTWIGAWKSMPPHRPAILSTFLGKIARRTALNRWRDARRQKRGGGEVDLALDELAECLPGRDTLEDKVEQRELAGLLNRFLMKLPETERRVFVSRYWYLYPVSEIAARFGFSQSKVKSMLFRVRGKLMTELKREGVI